MGVMFCAEAVAPHTPCSSQQDIPSPTVSSLLGTQQERRRAGVSQNRQDQHCEKNPACPRVWRTPSLPHDENTQRGDDSFHQTEAASGGPQVPPQPQHMCGLCLLDFWDTHIRLQFVTQAPQDTHTPWNNTRLHPSSLPWGVIHPCGRIAYPCQERWQAP